jgi:uncharacterized protein involved in exopolysaccharide biosynthesis
VIGRAVKGLLRHNVLVGLLVGLLVFAAGWGYTERQPTTYTATAVLSVLPRPDAPVPAGTVLLIAQSYVVFLSSTEVISEVTEANGTSWRAVAAGTEVTLEPQSANLRVDVKLPDPEEAASTANGLTAAAAARAQGNQFVTVERVSPALARTVEVNPPRRFLLALAAFGAICAAAFVSYVLAYRGPRRSESDRVSR